MTSTPAPVAAPAREPERPPAPRRWRGAAAVLGALVAAWLVPVATDALRLDWVLLPLALLATAALLRSGRTLLDRTVVALALLYSATCAFGLLFSVWPWRLQPVPIAGFGFTVLVLAYAATGRRPRLPLRWRGADAAVLGGAAVTAGVALWPLLHRDLAGRLALFMHVEDFSRHLMMFDAVRMSGGYMFLHRPVAEHLSGASGYTSYPHGSHFVTAVAENFLRSEATPGDALTWTSDYIWWHTAGYVAVCLAALWGLARLAGPAARPFVLLPLTALGTAYLALGDPIAIFDRGYPQELAALALVAVLVAVVCRPLARTREQLVVLGALLVGISFSYYLFLPVVTALAGAWLLVYRRRVRRYPWLALVAVALTALGVAVIPVQNVRATPPGQQLLFGGQASPVDGGMLAALMLLAGAGLVLLIARRSVGARLGLAAAVLATVFVAAIRAYQLANHGQAYFSIKAAHLAMVITVVLLGSLAHAGRPVPRRAAGRAAMALAAAALTVAPLVAFIGARETFTPGRRYVTGGTSEQIAAARNAVRYYRLLGPDDTRTTVLLMDGAWPQFLSSVYLGVFRHDYRATYGYAYPIRPWLPDHSVRGVKGALAIHDLPLRVITDNPDTLRDLREYADQLPPGRLVVVDARSYG